jgi:hypothetical protein
MLIVTNFGLYRLACLDIHFSECAKKAGLLAMYERAPKLTLKIVCRALGVPLHTSLKIVGLDC